MRTLWGWSLVLWAAVAWGGGQRPTGVGSGGDDVDRFLRNTRASLVQTLTRVRRGEETAGLCRCKDPLNADGLCRFLAQLTEDQTAFCRKFILETAEQMYRLNAEEPVTPFVLSADPLLVPDPSGALRPVMAKTDSGPKGKVWFHYEGIRGLSPVALLALVGHEFGHKVSFGNPAEYIDDNLPIGPFNKVEGGRLLLDAVGAALARYAADHGLTVQHFGVEDQFACEVEESRSRTKVSASGYSPRHFRDENLRRYETSIGHWPGDLTCGLNEGRSALEFRVKVTETQGCEDGPEGRGTELQLWRTFSTPLGAEGPPPILLLKKELPGWSPVCAKDDGRMRLEFLHGPRHIVFTARYKGLISKGRSERDRGGSTLPPRPEH